MKPGLPRCKSEINLCGRRVLSHWAPSSGAASRMCEQSLVAVAAALVRDGTLEDAMMNEPICTTRTYQDYPEKDSDAETIYPKVFPTSITRTGRKRSRNTGRVRRTDSKREYQARDEGTRAKERSTATVLAMTIEWIFEGVNTESKINRSRVIQVPSPVLCCILQQTSIDRLQA